MTSTQDRSSVVDHYGVESYKDPLIWFSAEDFEAWQHRQFRMDKDPYIKTYIHKLDCEIFFDKPKFTPDIFGGKEEEGNEDESFPAEESTLEVDAQELDSQPDLEMPPQDDVSQEEGQDEEAPSIEADVSEDWDNERWSKLLIEMADKCRGHRFCVVDMYEEPPYWKVYYEREIKEMYYDDNENPTGCKVEWGRNLVLADEYEWFEEELTFYNPNNEDNDQTALLVCFGNEKNGKLGENDLEDIWTTAIYMNYIDLDIKNNAKMFYHLVYGDALSSDNKQALVNTFDIAGSSHGIGAKKGALEEIRGIAPAKPEYCIAAKQEMLQKFAAACRMPLMYFRSESDLSKAFGMSGQDDARVTKKKLAIFGEFFPYIKTLIKMRWNIDVESGEPYTPETEQEEIVLSPNDRTMGMDSPEFKQNQKKMEDLNK